MSEDGITRVTLQQARALDRKTDWEKFDSIDPDADDDDGEFDWENAEVVSLPVKEAVSIRLDDDVLAYFRASGKGYQTRINAVLRSYMKAKKAG